MVVYYDRDELPLFVAVTTAEYTELFTKYTGSSKNVAYTLLTRLLNGHEYRRLKLVEADTVAQDCFEEEDKEFIEFIEKTRKKTMKERIEESGLSERSYFRKMEAFRKRSKA